MRWLVVLIALSLAGCDCSHHDVENWSYACTVDGTCPDGSTVIDSGARPDAGTPGRDGGADAGALDAGGPDAAIDAGAVIDSGVDDAGLVDAGLTDAGLFDAGPFDAGRADGGLSVPDAGTTGWQCTMGWCWVHPRPFGTPSFVKMMGPDLAVIAGRRWLIVSDGGAWTQVPLPDQETLIELATTSNETWLLLENSVRRFSATNLTLQTYAWPGFRYGRLSVSGDGGVWVNDYASSNGLFRAQAPGWVQVNTPCIDEFAPVGALDGVMRCNAGWGPTELWSVGQGRSPSKLFVNDGGISSLTAATPDTIFFTDFLGDMTLYRAEVDGGFAPYPRAVSGRLQLGSDGQPFQADSTFLYRIVGSSWQATNSFANRVSVIDLWGERGLNLSPYGELELFDATSSRQLMDYDVTRSHRTTYLAPQFFEGPEPSPRFLIDFTHIYALTDAGTLVYDLELPRAASTIVGNRDGGFLFVSSQAYVVQYAGGAFTERFVPMAGNGVAQLAETTGGSIFVRTTFPNRLTALLTDGGTLALDAGFDPQGLTSFGADQVLVFRKTPPAAVVIDGRTFEAMPFVLPAVSTIEDVCQAGTRVYSVGQGGVRWQDAPGSWQLATNRVTFGPVICSEIGASAIASSSAIIYRIDGGASSEHVSPFWSPPTRSFLDRLGRLWASQSPSDIAVHP